MVKKKDLIIVALATFCLTATLFMVRPTKSNPGIGEYNSWTDLNGDGTVDIYDAITLADAYGTSGDSTRNVNVVSMPSRQGYEAYALEGDYFMDELHHNFRLFYYTWSRDMVRWIQQIVYSSLGWTYQCTCR
jgi:hypothetical protein